MKSILVTLLAVLSVNAMALSPFTWSGKVIQAIFKSEKAWRVIGGPVLLVAIKSATTKGHTYEFTTRESRTVSGVTKQVNCRFRAVVEFKGDPIIPVIEVTEVTVISCPN